MSSAPNLEELSLAYNIIREVPSGTFDDLNSLKIVNMYGNMLSFISPETFRGVADTVEYLDLGFNLITGVGEVSFPRLVVCLLSPSFLSLYTLLFFFAASSTSTWRGTASST